MQIYPALKVHMGDWTYYIVKMRMREVAAKVNFAHDIYDDKTLSDAVQRVLNENRVKKQIVGYLARRPDRFFSSIVVAAMDGEPSWHPVEMDTSVVPKIFTASSSLKDSFGVLSFGDEPKYYALDGQHRVKAIKLLVSGDAEFEAPSDFANDMLSVIVVLREEHDVSEGEWMRRYRRLFSSLNRWAKPTDKDTDIIMDEDDLFSILTRRLITDHEFFRAPGRERESIKVQTEKKNLKKDAPQFTSLQTLYEINITLLSTRERDVRGWLPSGEGIDKQIRPDEEYIDKWYEELAVYWDAILEALPVLRENPTHMRVHQLSEPNPNGYRDHLLFWPIGQELFAKVVRALLDGVGLDDEADVDAMAAVLRPLAEMRWDLHESPWRYLLLVPTTPEEKSWRMRSEDRKEAVKLAYRLLCWIAGLDSLNEDDTEELRKDWQNLLIRPEENQIDKMWQEIVEIRARIATGNGE